jgi:hypothetical protein
MVRNILHITLETGDSVMVPASHVQPASRRVLGPIVEQLVREGAAMVPVPGPRPWRLSGAAEPGRCLSVTVQARLVVWVDVVWLGVALHSRCGAVVWRAMHSVQPHATDASRQPATPWLATRIMPSAVLLPPEELREAMAWMADLSECLAWVWAEQKDQSPR